MPETQRLGLDHNTLLAYQRQYHSQKRLADSLFTLFRTLGSALQVEHVANVGLLTLTGQLLIKCAGFFQRRDEHRVNKPAPHHAKRAYVFFVASELFNAACVYFGF